MVPMTPCLLSVTAVTRPPLQLTPSQLPVPTPAAGAEAGLGAPSPAGQQGCLSPVGGICPAGLHVQQQLAVGAVAGARCAVGSEEEESGQGEQHQLRPCSVGHLSAKAETAIHKGSWARDAVVSRNKRRVAALGACAYI